MMRLLFCFNIKGVVSFVRFLYENRMNDLFNSYFMAGLLGFFLKQVAITFGRKIIM